MIKDNQPHLISVIVPVYNVEKYLRQCLDSIINQTYRNLEIILVDDGSTDSSGIICDEYAQIDARIKVIHKENGGLSSARNAGLDVCISGGDYVAFVDSDDWLELDMYERLYETSKKYNADIVASKIYLEYKNKTGFLNERYWPQKVVTIDEFNKMRLFKDVCYQRLYYTTVCNKLYNSQIFKKLRFPHYLYEDVFVILDILRAASVIALLPEHKYHYRQREGSIMYKEFSDTSLDIIEAWKYNVLLLEDWRSQYIDLGKMKYLQAHKGIVNKIVISDNCSRHEGILNQMQSIIRENLFFIIANRYMRIHEKIECVIIACNTRVYRLCYRLLK